MLYMFLSILVMELRNNTMDFDVSCSDWFDKVDAT
jgi:hypothetical protein